MPSVTPQSPDEATGTASSGEPGRRRAAPEEGLRPCSPRIPPLGCPGYCQPAPPTLAALTRGWDAGGPRRRYGALVAGNPARGSLARALAQLACGILSPKPSEPQSPHPANGDRGARCADERWRCREEEEAASSIAEPSRALGSWLHARSHSLGPLSEPGRLGCLGGPAALCRGTVRASERLRLAGLSGLIRKLGGARAESPPAWELQRSEPQARRSGRGT